MKVMFHYMKVMHFMQEISSVFSIIEFKYVTFHEWNTNIISDIDGKNNLSYLHSKVEK